MCNLRKIWISQLFLEIIVFQRNQRKSLLSIFQKKNRLFCNFHVLEMLRLNIRNGQKVPMAAYYSKPGATLVNKFKNYVYGGSIKSMHLKLTKWVKSVDLYRAAYLVWNENELCLFTFPISWHNLGFKISWCQYILAWRSTSFLITPYCGWGQRCMIINNSALKI